MERELECGGQKNLEVGIAQAAADWVFGQLGVFLGDLLRCPAVWADKEQVLFDNQLPVDFRHKT